MCKNLHIYRNYFDEGKIKGARAAAAAAGNKYSKEVWFGSMSSNLYYFFMTLAIQK